MRNAHHLLPALGACLLLGTICHAQQAPADLAATLQKLDAKVIPADSDLAKSAGQIVSLEMRARRELVNHDDVKAWRTIQTKADWEKFRDVRIKALAQSLGTFPPPPAKMNVHVTGKLAGDGYVIENVVYETRPGWWVTANLYLPSKPSTPAPGFLIIHSHHNPKTQSELQDMGMTWARLGCMVLVPDQLGHGERRQHDFSDAGKYPGSFKPSRQDYYFRYNSSLQLYLIGDSLMGWMAYDLMRGVDLLLSKGVDAKRLSLLGSVAGGGDPAGVTAALEPRIAAVAPFNFGGPQPETKFPLPEDAELSFNYLGGGSWESTRNLRMSGKGGFLPWVIVGSVAPRGVIHAHEFVWDEARDPVWKRYQKIFGFYGATGMLDFAAGKGSVKGASGPDNTHCNNIGAVHRKPMYPTLKRWFDIPVPDKDYQVRHMTEELLCLTPQILKKIDYRPLHEICADLAKERLKAADANLSVAKRWERLLDVSPAPMPVKAAVAKASQDGVASERAVVLVEGASGNQIPIPILILVPTQSKDAKVPVVVAIAQEGKQGFLKQRAETIARLLRDGVAVVLPDLRGTGETRPSGDSRGRAGLSTSLSATEFMLGQTMLGQRLGDLRTVLAFVRQQPYVDASRIALWGDSFAAVNPEDTRFAVPWDADKLPAQSEPLGGLLALLGAAVEPGIKAVYVRGGLASYQSVLESPYLYLPHDAIVPGALTVGDLPEVAAYLAPRPVRLEGLVDGLNRQVKMDRLTKYYPASATLSLQETSSGPEQVAAWLKENLGK